MSPTGKFEHFMRVAVLTGALTALGLVGNYFPLPLFFSVSFLFGGIAAFIALITLGIYPALFVSIVAGSLTWYLWGHPYALVIFTAEILFVGLLRKHVRIYAFSDFLFWLLLGVPMIAVFYLFVMDLNSSTVFLIILKQPINGILNAIIATLIVSVISILIRKRKQTNQAAISAKQLIVSVLLLMTMLAGGIPIILNNYRVQAMQEDNLVTLMTNYGNAVVEEISIVRNLVGGDEVEAIFKAEEFARHRLKMQDLGISITYSDPVRRVQIGWIKQYSGTGDMSQVRGPLYIWKPSGNIPEVQRWIAAEYYIALPVKVDMNISEVIVTHIAAPIVKKLDELRAQTLIALTVLLVIALAVCYFLTEALVAPLRRLALAGSDRQNNFDAPPHAIQYPRSPIREYDDLAQALQKNSDEVLENINALTDMRNTLELRVEQRTAELFRLSTVASQTHNGVLIMDITGIIEWVNDGLLRMTGYSEKDYLGQYPSSVLSGPETSSITAKRMSDALNERNSFQEEILYYTRNNEEIWIEIFCNPMTDDQGVLSGFIAIFNDVTQRRLDQLNLVKARIEAERSNEAKSLFLSTMSHEIRTPLNGVMGMTQLLAGTKLDPEQQSHLKAINGSCTTLLAIVNDVLDMSKIEAGALELEETPFSLKDLMASTLTPFKALASEKNLDLNLAKLPPLKGEIVGDPVRIRQVIWNLVSNAIKFTEKGSVDISLDLSETEDPQEYILKVRDTGAGIAPDRLKDIFDPFIQEDNTITRKFGGTGLGLSIVKKLIEMMGGEIDIESRVGKGTEFSVRLPLIYAQSPSKAKKEANLASHRKGAHVLVAEDNFVNITIAKTFLEKLDCKVTVAENGKLAVEAVKKNKPDLVFMDIHMPEMDGVTATTEIRKDEQFDDMPIVGLTADAFKDSKKKFKQAGMIDVLTKPFTEEQMQEKLALYIPEETDLQTVNSVSDTEEQQTQSETPIGDDKQFATLKNVLGEEMIQSMLDVAPGSFRKNLKLIQQALDEAHSETITEASHAIKGSAGALYALRLAEQAAYIQNNSHDMDAVKSVLTDFEDTVEHSIKWLHQK